MLHVRAQRLLPCLVVLWTCLAIACVFLLTLGTDEAWVLNGIRSCQEPPVAYLTSEPNETNGGLFAAANLVLEILFGSQVWVHRLFSLFSVLSLIAIAASTIGISKASLATRCIAIAPLLSIPGTAEVGAIALGTGTGVTLLVLAAVVWYRSSTPGIGRVILCGGLFGLAAASRFDLCLFGPAFLLVDSVHSSRDGAVRIRWPGRALCVVMLAAAIFVANIIVMQSIIARLEVITDVQPMMNATGTSSLLKFLDYPRTLNKIVIAQSFAPLGLLALAALLPFLATPECAEPSRSNVSLWLFLIGVGWTLWFGWLFQAPIPHLRYLWPSLACFAIVAGHGLALLYENSRGAPSRFRSLGILLIAAALIAGGTLTSFRSIVIGESDYLSWEWSREMALDYFRRFQHLDDQRDVMEYLRDLPSDETIVCLGKPFPFRYLAHRPIVPIEEFIERPAGMREEAYLIVPPAIGTYLCLSPEAFHWIELNCELSAQFGRYSIYIMPPDLPSEPEILIPARANYWQHPQSIPWSDWDALWKDSPDQQIPASVR